MFRVVIHTEIDIRAGTGPVWRVLTDLAAYPEWNPMIRRAEGRLRPGDRLTLRFAPPGRPGHTFRPRLLTVAENRELRWRGSPGAFPIFSSEHLFVLDETSPRGCRLRHDMLFYGLLVPLLNNRLRQAVLEPFTAMNRALKERVERSG